MELNVYDVLVQTEVDGIFAVSLVDMPANKHKFLAFSDLKLRIDGDRQILAGPLLIPDQLIDRKGPGPSGEEVWFIKFNKNTIQTVSENLAKNLGQTAITLMHAGVPVNATLVSMWLTGNPDKSQAYGFDLPEGSLFVEMRVLDEMSWDVLVKSGAVQGFSVELQPTAFHYQGQATLLSDESTNKQKTEITMNFEKYKLVDGTEIEVSAVEVGGSVMVAGAPAPDGVHTLEDGTVVTTKDGLIEAIEVKVEMVEEIVEAPTETVAEAVAVATAAFEQRIVALEEIVARLVNELEVEAVEAASEQPAEQSLSMRQITDATGTSKISAFKSVYKAFRG